ncbi:MAG: winged helix-turn-helix domain-containing protein [Pseudomonadota bacterium]
MSGGSHPAGRKAFASFVLDRQRGALTENGRAIPLRPKTYAVLDYFVDHPKRLISKEELIEAVWPDTVVSDDSVTHCIVEIRKALGDTERRLVKTVPKRGFTFDATVTDELEATQTPLRSARSASTSWMIGAAAAVFIAGALAAFLFWPAPSDGERSVAVLPLDDISPSGDQAYLGFGIADELRLELQRLEGLRVAGRTSSNAFADQDSQTIGDRLNVDSILEGSIRRDGDRVRIAVQLTNAADGFVFWSQRYSRELNRIFEMQEEIATEVAGELGVTLGVGDINAFRGAGTRSVEAYETYLRARGDRYTDMSSGDAVRLLERVVELDPNYAVAWSELANRVFDRLWNASIDEQPAILERVYTLAQRAVELDPESADVKSALARASMGRFDWIAAEENHSQAIELLADRVTIDRFAVVLMRTGRMAKAAEQFHAAIEAEGVDGRLHPQIWHVYLAQGRFEEAQQILDFRGSSDLHEDSLDIALSQGDPEKVRAVMRTYPQSDQAYLRLYSPVLAAFDSPDRVYSVLRDVYENEHLQWPRKLHEIAMVAAYFGYSEFALEVKEREVSVTPLRLVAIFYPVMSEARQLPEFRQLMSDLNLVEYWRAYGWPDACKPVDSEDFACR